MSTEETVGLLSRDGGRIPALVYRPSGQGPFPAVVIGVEAYGINDFGRGVASRLAAEGYVVVVPDYYRGNGPVNPEDYLDFAEVMRFITALDFTAATHDQLAAVDYAAGLGIVDPGRIAVWGYCTGATLSMLAAELSARVAAAVLFFPSQPRFAELTDRTPVHPVDLAWALRCPTLIIYGDQDTIMPPGELARVRDRLARWGVDAEIKVYEGAGHAFSAPVPPLRNDKADRDSWHDAVEFLARRFARQRA
jgi:carboxymethylenebutenolidase